MSKDHFAFLNSLSDIERTALEDGLELQHYAIFNSGVDHDLIERIMDGNETVNYHAFLTHF